MFCKIAKKPHRPSEPNLIRLYEMVGIELPQGRVGPCWDPERCIPSVIYCRSSGYSATPNSLSNQTVPASAGRSSGASAIDDEAWEVVQRSSSMYWILEVTIATFERPYSIDIWGNFNLPANSGATV